MGLYTWRTFFNPFALRINHYEKVMVEFEDKPVHTRGDYKVYERAGKYFTCYCGIIIAQTTKVPRGLIESLAHGVEPSGTEKWRYSPDDQTDSSSHLHYLFSDVYRFAHSSRL